MRTAAASAAVAVVLLDVTAVGVLLPTIRVDLGSSASGGQWVMNAYLLALAVLLPLAARVRIDDRLVTAAGAVTMAAGAAVSASADSTGTLVAGRAVEGAGVALLIASLGVALPANRRAAAAAVTLPALALAFGPLAGGELAEHNWWHLCFWAGVPAAIALGAAVLVDGGRRETPARKLDFRTLALTTGLVAVTILFVQSEPWGVGTGAVVALLGVAAAAPLIAGVLAPGRTVWAAAAGALAVLCFLMPQYFELAHLIHPLRSGVRLSALTIAAVAGGAVGWQLRAAVPSRALGIAGAVAASAGAIALYWVDEKSGNALFGAGLILAGGGFGLAAGAICDGRVGDLLPAAATGAALSLAISGALFQHVYADQRGNGNSFEHALSRGVASGALMLLPLAIAVGASAWRAETSKPEAIRPASSAARPAAES